jgi:hypothetical protein
VKTDVVCGGEIWPVTEMDMIRLNIRERKILRRLYGPVVEEEVWRITTKGELRELCKNLDIVTDTEKKTLGWIGYLGKVDRERVLNEIFESESKGRRRTRLRWLEDFEQDLQEMKVER